MRLKLLLIFSVFIFCFNGLISQTSSDSYIILGDHSGIKTNQIGLLETASDSLVATLPAVYQDSFKVFDFGYYTYNDNMVGGLGFYIEKIKSDAKINSKYYFVFGKLISEGEKKLIVSINLPKGDSFTCIFEENPGFNSDFSYLLSGKANLTEKSYSNSILWLLQYTTTFLDEKLECCITRQECNHCNVPTVEIDDTYYYEYSGITTKLMELGFRAFPAITILDSEYFGIPSSAIQNSQSDDDVENLNLNATATIFTSDYSTKEIIEDTYQLDDFADYFSNSIELAFTQLGYSISVSEHYFKFPRDCNVFDSKYEDFQNDISNLKIMYAYVGLGEQYASAALFYKIEGFDKEKINSTWTGSIDQEIQEQREQEFQQLRSMVNELYDYNVYFESFCGQKLFSRMGILEWRAAELIGRFTDIFDSYDHSIYKKGFYDAIEKAYETVEISDDVYDMAFAYEKHFVIIESLPTLISYGYPIASFSKTAIDLITHYNLCSEIIHCGLDICGTALPVCDGINAIIYTLEGAKVEASLSAIAIIPFGEIASLSKRVIKNATGEFISTLSTITIKSGKTVISDLDDVLKFAHELGIQGDQAERFKDFATFLLEHGKIAHLIDTPSKIKAWKTLDDAGAVVLKSNTTWLGRVSSWADEGIEVAFAKNGDFIEVFRTSDGLQIGRIVDGNGDEVFEAVADGFVPIASPSSGTIVSSKVLDVPVKRPCGHEITSGASIVKTSDGTVGIVEDVSSYSSAIIRDALSAPNKKLRDALKQAGLVSSTEQAHHLIPIELLKNNTVVQDAVEAGFDFNGLVNGKGLSSIGNPPIHRGSHPDYTSLVETKIQNWFNTANNAGNYSADAAKTFMDGLTNNIKQVIDANPSTPVNQLVF